MRKHITRIVAAGLVGLLFLGTYSTRAIAANDPRSSEALKITRELTKKEYNGRQTGTEGYSKAINFIEGKLKEVQAAPLLKENSYRQEYDTAFATLKSHSVRIGGRELEIMKDYMPFAKCSSVDGFNANDIYYAGVGREEDYKKGQANGVVIFKWNDQSGKFGGGVSDRVEIAKRHGAKAVLVIANGELEIGNYEHPLSGQDVGIPGVYISEAVARNILNVPNTDKPAVLLSKSIKISMDIERKSAKGENLVAVIPGKVEEKAILITTNLDGFGSLPDGRYYESAQASAVSVEMMLELARYYKQNVPEYNLILAFVGSKWTDNNGIKELSRVIDFNNIAFSIDLYAMGGNGRLLVNYIDEKNKGLAEDLNKKISSVSIYNPNDFGNALSSSLSQKSKNVLLIRDQGTWIPNSLTDKYENVSVNSYLKGLDNLKTVIDTVIKYDRSKETAFSYSNISVKKEYFKEVKREINYKESKYFKVYFDREFEAYINDYYMKEIDKIYERISKFNYYPAVGEKVKLLNLKDGNEAAVIADREDLFGNSQKAGGGFASVTRPVIYCRQPALGTVSHELNHLLANYKGYGRSENGDHKNGVAQESQGQSFLVSYRVQDYVTDVNTLINQYFNSHESPDVLAIARDYKTKLNWESYITAGKDYNNNWQNTYHTLGSIYTFIKYAYGDNASRRAMYRVYDLQPSEYKSYKNSLIKDLNINTDNFLEDWSQWMTSSGEKVRTRTSISGKKYEDKLLQYDYSKIYTLYVGSSGQGQKTSGFNSSNSGSGTLDVSKVPLIKSNQKDFFSYKDDGNKYAAIDYKSNLKDKGFKMHSVAAAVDEEHVYIKIKFSNPSNQKPLVFLQEDSPGLREWGAELSVGDNTVIMKFNKSALRKYKAGLAINIGSGNFVFIEKWITDALAVFE